MFTIYVTYEGSDRTSIKGFYNEIRANHIDELSKKENGNVCYEYYWPAANEKQLFLIEKWESKEAQQVHAQQEHFKMLGELKAKYGVETTVVFE